MEQRALQSLSAHSDNDNYTVQGYATTFNKPYFMYEIDGIKYYEVIDRHALNSADMSDVILQYDHQGKVMARTSNGTLILDCETDGLHVTADLSKSKASKELYEEISNGLITKMSWAFTVLEDNYNRDTHTRTITKIGKVYDVSAVSIPANNDTQISARNYFNTEIEKEQIQLRRRKLILELELTD